MSKYGFNTHARYYVRYSLFSADFTDNMNVSTTFCETPQYEPFMKIRSEVPKLVTHTGVRNRIGFNWRRLGSSTRFS